MIFAYPMWDANSAMAAVRDSGRADRAATLLLGLSVQGKRHAMLSMLFGAGLVLQGARMEAGDRQATLVLVRRGLVLLLIGLLHGILLCSADILAFYAIVSLVALWFRRIPARAMLAASVAATLSGVIILGAYGAAHPADPIPGPRIRAARVAVL